DRLLIPAGGGAWQQLDLASARCLRLAATVGATSMRAVINTGATRSVIRDQLALQLGLPYIGATLTGTFTRDVVGSLYRVERLTLDGVGFNNISVGSFEVAQLASLPEGVSLVIGQDVLQQVALHVQFTKDRARLLAPSSIRSMSGYRRLSLVGTARQFPALEMRLEAHGLERAVVDLSSSVPVSISRDYAAQLGILGNRPISTTMIRDSDGVSVDQIFVARKIEFGPFTLNEVPVCVVGHWEFASPISLGWPFFAAFDAIFSLGESRLLLRGDAARIAAPFPRDRSGIGGQRGADSIIIRHVAVNSPAAAAGLKPGDMIVRIDGRRIDHAFPPQGERLGQEPGGTRIRLDLSDGRAVILVLADYF
uniref:aspartyl protease family protein n=1 Tax=Sphingomonas sp. TaxID=28214 RepID=UPI003B3A6AF9